MMTTFDKRSCIIGLLIATAAILSLSGYCQTPKGKTVMDRVKIYRGGIIIQSITGAINVLQNGQVATNYTVRLQNISSTSQRVEAGFRKGDKKSITVEKGETATLNFSPFIEIRKDSDGSLLGGTFDMVFLLNDSLPANPPEGATIQIAIPESYEYLRVNQAGSRRLEGSMKIFEVKTNNKFLTNLKFALKTNGHVASILKTVNLIRNTSPYEYEIRLQIKNTGKITLVDLLVTDDFEPADFQGEGPEFTHYVGEENDERLFWANKIEKLDVNESRDLTIKLTSTKLVSGVTLSAAAAKEAGKIVGVSNKVQL